MLHLLALMHPYIPSDNCRQSSARQIVCTVCAENDCVRTVLDLGCGQGESLSLFRGINPDVRWIGLEIESRPQSQTAASRGTPHCRYDGSRMPFSDGQFDMVFTRQVFEHVRYPERVLEETFRVLRPGGWFIGSTSHLEPFHSYSVWNYTPFGFHILLADAGFRLLEIRPGIDAVTLILHRFAVVRRLFARFFEHESPANLAISIAGKVMGKKTSWINAVKLNLSGHFCFIAQRPDDLSRQ